MHEDACYEEVAPIERMRRRLSRQLHELQRGLERLEHRQEPDAAWARPIYQNQINRCCHWLDLIAQEP